jgi:hypothetical protein
MRRQPSPGVSAAALDPQETRAGFFAPLLDALDWVVNTALEMTYPAGLIRSQMLGICLIITWSLLAFINHPIQDWQKAVFALIDPTTLPEVVNPPLNLLTNILSAYFALDVLGHLIALILPFYLAWKLAAIFLDDIFELKDVNIASRFITQAAFVYPSFGTIHLEEGEVRPSDRKSTIYHIGGPGQVRVSLENVAVFEKIDGMPELIGPTTGSRFFTRTLDGFERLRQVFDIRDLAMPPIDLRGRTKDGIPITVQNIRLLFSVQRDTPYTTLSRPYPYSREAIFRLVYDQPKKGPWTNSVAGLVRGELINFISEHTLGEIFAAVGEPEVNRQIQKQSILQKLIYQHRNRSRRYQVLNQLRVQNFSTPARNPVERHFTKSENPKYMVGNRPSRWFKRVPRPARHSNPRAVNILSRIHYPHRPAFWQQPPEWHFQKKFVRKVRYPLIFRTELLYSGEKPNFIPRLQLSRRFYEDFARSFPERASQRGVRLEWIDVGTWHPPADVILDQHQEAFHITTENMQRGDRVVLDDLRRQGQAEELIRLIRRPIYRFLELQRQQLDRDETIYFLIEEYLGILRAARDEFIRDGIPLPDRLLPAIEQIQRYQRVYMQKNRARYI